MRKLLILLVAILVLILSSCDDKDERDNKTNDDTYTVSFEANGGSPAPAQQKIKQGEKVTQPDVMIKEESIFCGWYKDNSYTNEWNFDVDTVWTNITLYAKWVTKTVVPGNDFDEKLGWVTSNAQNDGYYIIEINNDLTTGQKLLYFDGKKITIDLRGIGTRRTINLNSVANNMFEIHSGVTLIINSNIELKAGNSSYSSIIKVEYGGSLVLNQGAKINGNTSSVDGVHIYNWAYGIASFIMNGGEISGNTGSGVYVYGTFTMNGYGNTFIMNGGKISGNTGRGVYVYGTSTFTMNGGEISGNTGRGVFVDGLDSIYIGGTFTMNGGEIKGNEFRGTGIGDGAGAGVYINGSFNKTGGIIYGYTVGDNNSNVVKNYLGSVVQKKGHAVYATSSIVRFKDTTSGEDNNLLFDGNKNPPPLSGAWDQ